MFQLRWKFPVCALDFVHFLMAFVCKPKSNTLKSELREPRTKSNMTGFTRVSRVRSCPPRRWSGARKGVGLLGGGVLVS